jgi:WD40 repeat protein
VASGGSDDLIHVYDVSVGAFAASCISWCRRDGLPPTLADAVLPTHGLNLLQAGKDLGFLVNPGEGAVTALDFHSPQGRGGPSHLLSGSADGTLCIWEVNARIMHALGAQWPRVHLVVEPCVGPWPLCANACCCADRLEAAGTVSSL